MAALKEILSSEIFVIISLKHFQFSGVNKPGHDKKRPIKIPKDSNKKNLITKTLTLLN